MWNKIKRSNRGLILAVIAVISLIIFIAYDEITFKANVPELRELTQSYFTQLASASIMDEQYINKKDNSLTDEGIKKLKSNYKDVVEEFFVHSQNQDSMGMSQWMNNKSHILGQDWAFDENRGHVTKYDFDISRINVTKEGPGLALLEIEYSMTVVAKGGPVTVLTPTRSEIFNINYSINSFGKMGNEDNNYDLEVQYNMVMRDWNKMQIEAKKVGGQWRFYGINGWNEYDYTILSGDIPTGLIDEESEWGHEGSFPEDGEVMR
jgi:hypothetical protein